MITHEHLLKAMNYSSYRRLIEELLETGKTTGGNQSPEYVEYSKINLQRMTRLEKTTRLGEELLSALDAVKMDCVWVVLTEGWCGDASQNIPVLEAMEKACPRIDLKVLLREENEEVMNQYLTDGSRSIPKLICLQRDSLKELFTWGPRPQELQQLVVQLIKDGVSKAERGLITQKWYNSNKTEAIQKEFAGLIRQHMA